MNTRFWLTLSLACLTFMIAQAQNFDEPTVRSANKTYLVKKIGRSVFLNDEEYEHLDKKATYQVDTLNLSGLAWKKAQIDVTDKVKHYLQKQRKIDLSVLPNVSTRWYILKTGQIKAVSFVFPPNLPLTAQDFEEMEKIITQTKIEVTHPQFYKSVNYISLHIPFIWNKPVVDYQSR